MVGGEPPEVGGEPPGTPIADRDGILGPVWRSFGLPFGAVLGSQNRPVWGSHLGVGPGGHFWGLFGELFGVLRIARKRPEKRPKPLEKGRIRRFWDPPLPR